MVISMSEIIVRVVSCHKIIRQRSKSYRLIMHFKRKAESIKSLLEAKERRFGS